MHMDAMDKTPAIVSRDVTIAPACLFILASTPFNERDIVRCALPARHPIPGGHIFRCRSCRNGHEKLHFLR
jgi:hypothetical protein